MDVKEIEGTDKQDTWNASDASTKGVNQYTNVDNEQIENKF